jgi:hypothetical protein
VALKRQHGIVAQHAAAIVGHSNKTAATLFGSEANIHRTRVQRVFKKLLDNGSWAFHYFAGRNLVGDGV